MANIKSRRHAELYYLKGTMREEGDDTIYPVMDLIVLPYDGVKFYGSFFLRISQVTQCASMLYYWLVMEMSEMMAIGTDAFSRNRFRSYAKKLNFEYGDSTVKHAIKELIDVELLIVVARARCRVNPEFCFLGKEQDRIMQIKMSLKAKKELEGYKLSKDKNEVQKKTSSN